MKFDIDEGIKQCTGYCRLGYIVIRNVKVQGAPPVLAQKLFQLQTALAALYNIDGLAKVPQLARVRSVYNQNNFDATRYTLDAEMLVRRILQNKDAYYVNSAAAAINYCSLKFLLPAGVYDLDQINGNITYGLPSEDSYLNSNGKTIATDGQPFLYDNSGIFGNANTQTRRTAVTLSTNNLLAVVYANEKVTTEQLLNILDFTRKKLTLYNEGIVELQEIIGVV